MKKVLSQMYDWLESGQDVVFSTIIASSGSAPRGLGAHMAVTAENGLVGTIGGGAVEFRAQQMSQVLLKEKKSRLEKFVLSPNEVADIGMICGGEVTVYMQFLPANSEAVREAVNRGISCFKEAVDSWLVLDLTVDSKEPFQILLGDELPSGHDFKTKVKTYNRGGKDYYFQQLSAEGKVFVFGGGHVSQALVPLLTGVGFYTVVYDDNENFANKEKFPTANEVVVGSFGELFKNISISQKDYVVILTRGHISDFGVQEQIMKGEMPYYLGVIGSRKKISVVSEKLEKAGVPKALIDKVHTPIGLNIKGETPEEIGISIVAELILVRAESGR